MLYIIRLFYLEMVVEDPCSALQRVGYDYWKIDPVAAGGRITEVAADIHTANPGPDNAREYCEER